MHFGLDRMRRLLNVLGLPQVSYPTIHVVGTNGKSSTTRMIAALLEREGLATGCYTSPHLLSYRERIQVARARDRRRALRRRDRADAARRRAGRPHRAARRGTW